MVVQAHKFIHEKGYTHNDVKAQNLLVGLDKNSKDDVFLVDFGLACKYRDAFGFHFPEEPDERKAHDGTLEYTSRDAHTGAHSRRGDLETLGYNMVHWAAGTLPWLTELEDPEQVHNITPPKHPIFAFLRWNRARKPIWKTLLASSPNVLNLHIHLCLSSSWSTLKTSSLIRILIMRYVEHNA